MKFVIYFLSERPTSLFWSFHDIYIVYITSVTFRWNTWADIHLIFHISLLAIFENVKCILKCLHIHRCFLYITIAFHRSFHAYITYNITTLSTYYIHLHWKQTYVFVVSYLWRYLPWFCIIKLICKQVHSNWLAVVDDASLMEFKL